MPDPKVVLEQLIEENGGKLVRQQKHKVYHFPNGKVFTCALTPSCPLSYINSLTALKNLLGLNPPDRGTPGERREKRIKTRGKQQVFAQSGGPPKILPTWRRKLALAAKQVVPPPPPKPVLKHPVHRVIRPRPLTFEERMLRAGVRRLE